MTTCLQVVNLLNNIRMKKRLNIVTFIFIGIIICVSVFNVYLKSNLSIAEAADSTGSHTFSLNFSTNQESFPDTLYNEKTGERIPANIREGTIEAPKGDNTQISVVGVSALVMVLTAIIMLIFNFIKIIASVNKSIIFAWINVRRLRIIGLGFILFFVLDVLMSIYDSVATSGFVMEALSASYLIEGMIAFVVAEIFAVGLRLKEEQDLTI